MRNQTNCWTRTWLALVASAALVAAAAHADPPVHFVRGEDGDRLELDATFGSSWQDVNIGRLLVRGADRHEPIDLKIAPASVDVPTAKAHRLPIAARTGDGCAMIVADLGPAFEKGRPDAWRRVTHATKIVTCRVTPAVLTTKQVDDRRAAGGFLMAKTGSQAELQPLANPATLKPGADLPVRVYCRGMARAGIEVAAIRPDGSRRYAVTDAVGAAVLRVDAAGPWIFEAACTDERATNDSNASDSEASEGTDRSRAGLDASPLTASLHVDVLALDAWSAFKGGE